MTYAQAFLVLAAVAAAAVGVLVAASARWQRRGLLAASAALALTFGVFFLSRAVDANHGVRSSGTFRTAALLALVPVAIAAAIVSLRRGRGSPLVTGGLAWAGLLIAFLEGAYLLRS